MNEIQLEASSQNENKKSKNKWIVAICLVILIIIALTVVYLLKNSKSKSLENTYNNQKYNFSVQYPTGWQVDEDLPTFVETVFRPSSLSKQDLQTDKYDKNKDCFFTFVMLTARPDATIPCKNNVGEITLGSNKFTKCQMRSVQDDSVNFLYMIINPKTKNLMTVSYANNLSCQSITENSLSTLKFQ